MIHAEESESMRQRTLVASWKLSAKSKSNAKMVREFVDVHFAIISLIQLHMLHD